jgi:16S rRNA (cytosine967-C5)-methyltransferase
MNARALSLKILSAWSKRPGVLDTAIDRGLSLNPLDHRDTRFVYEIVQGVVKRKLTLDYVLSQFVGDPTVLDNQTLACILEIGAYQILYMDRVPDHASVNEAVNLTKLARPTSRFAGLVNATLRNLIQNRRHIRLPDPQKDLVKRLSIEFSHPEWMVRRWLDRLGLARTKLLLAFNNGKPDVFLRRKLHGLSRQQAETELGDLCDGASGFHNLFYRLKKSVAPDAIPLFREGECTVQAPSSGWIVALLAPASGERIIDLCSAPGGKSAFTAEITGSSGKVIACEIRKNRMMLAVETFRRMHLENVLPVICNGIATPFRDGCFDKVLLDAPCSGTGVLHRHPDGRWIKLEKDMERLTQSQKALLESSSRLVAKGGILVYSTCSIESEENESIVADFIGRHPDFVLDKPPQVIPQVFVSREGYVKITPYEHKLDGIFGARLRKVG